MKNTVLWGVACLLSSTAQALDVQYPLDNYAPGSFRGRVFGCCNPRHLGEDHAAAPLTPVYAIADGQVLTAEASGAHCNFGMVVIIEHTLDDGSKFISLYGHLSNRVSYRPRLNGMIRKGEIIGYVAHSGGLPPRLECRTAKNPDDENGDGGPHLHFAIRRGTPPRYPDGRYRWVYYGYSGRGQDVDFDAQGNPRGGLFTNPSSFLEMLGVNDQDSDGYTVAEGDCMDTGMTPEGVPASAVHPGATEVCNYTDDDCDGTTDEGFPGLLAPCTVGIGACANSGVNVCTTDFAGTACSVVPYPPSPETCDEVDNDCNGEADDGAPDCWRATSITDVSTARYIHSAIWTGEEMIVWGGRVNWEEGGADVLDTGGRYNPLDDNWSTTASVGAPSPRWIHTAIWTGSEMIVWGGDDFGDVFNTGGRYNPSVNSWITVSLVGAPSARFAHAAVWAGTEMIVWGGGSWPSNYVNSGGKYNPSTNNWITTSSLNAPSRREYHTAIWTGEEMIVWGGRSSTTALYSGGRYNPATNSWIATINDGAPTVRRLHTAIWTGSEMIVWGGDDEVTYFNTGGRYNPAADTWTTTSTIDAPSARSLHSAVWTGEEMIVWGGWDGSIVLNSGGIYDPAANTWTSIADETAPSARRYHTVIWTGSEMVVWGGYDGDSTLNTGGRYVPP